MQNNTMRKENLLEQFEDKFEINKIRVLKKSKEWEIIVSLKGLISISEITEAEEWISKHYGLNRTRIIIEKSNAELKLGEFMKNYGKELKDVIQNNNPAFIGFLKDAELEVRDTSEIVKKAEKIADNVVVI